MDTPKEIYEYATSKSQLISNEMMALLNEQFFYIPNWKWLALAALFFLAFIFRFVFYAAISKIKNFRLHIYKLSFYRHLSSHAIEKPLSSFLTLCLSLAILNAISPGEKLTDILTTLFKIMMIYHLIVLAYYCASAVGDTFEQISAKTPSTIDDQLAVILKKTLKVVVVVLGILIGLQNLGVNVTALLAGLGIGGIAIAFAAQDTVSNVFGTITILLDTPFKIGDRILVSKYDGTVEEVGFRSTRLRTLNNSIVIIPNSVIAKENIENLSARKFIRFRHIFGLEYSTTDLQITTFCDRIRQMLAQNTQIDKSRVAVHFNDYGESSLNILMSCHITAEGGKDAEEQQRILLQVYNIAAELNVQFAFPTRTVYLQQLAEKNEVQAKTITT